MRSHPRGVRQLPSILEMLEVRSLLSAPPTLTIPLDPDLDQFGDQVVSVQAYGDTSRTAFGIFDTGASALTFSADDQAIFTAFLNAPIPIKVFGGAQADGIGGSIVGDVSEPDTILADGLHAAELTFDKDGFPLFNFTFSATSAATPDIQAFVGTEDGSPDLPSITGTPILNPSPDNPHGYAAQIDLQGVKLDFSDVLPGLVLAMPDLHFVDPSTTLAAATGTTDPVRVSLSPYGKDNHDNPGDAITESPNETQVNVTVISDNVTLTHQNFLFDTGAQLSVISTAAAQALGLDLAHPTTTITVMGVAGSEDVPGFTIPELDVPRSDGGIIQFTNVPIYVLDVAPDIDGILGMNLFDTAASMLFNPLDAAGPSLSLTFYTNPDRGGIIDDGTLNFLRDHKLAFANAINGHGLPGFVLPKAATVHETTIGDYDGDRKTDLGVFRPGTAEWFIKNSTGGGQVTQFGAPSGDIPLQGDFDGDGRNDLAVYRPATGQWFIKRSQDGPEAISFGQAGVDIPVPGDYDHDGKTDLAVFRPTTDQWFILRSTAGPVAQQFGAPNLDMPVPAAFDGNNTTEIAVFRPTTAQWFIQGANGGRVIQFGATTDMPIPGDYDGDGKADLAVFRPSTAQWFIMGSTSGGRVNQFGAPNSDVPLPADYDGDNMLDLAVYRPSTAEWFINRSTLGPMATQFGAANLDVPLPMPLSERLQGQSGNGRLAAKLASLGTVVSTLNSGSTDAGNNSSSRLTISDANPFVVVPLIPQEPAPSAVSVASLAEGGPKRRHGSIVDTALASLAESDFGR